MRYRLYEFRRGNGANTWYLVPDHEWEDLIDEENNYTNTFKETYKEYLVDPEDFTFTDPIRDEDI